MCDNFEERFRLVSFYLAVHTRSISSVYPVQEGVFTGDNNTNVWYCSFDVFFLMVPTTHLPQQADSEMITFMLDNGAEVTLRTSGTGQRSRVLK